MLKDKYYPIYSVDLKFRRLTSNVIEDSTSCSIMTKESLSGVEMIEKLLDVTNYWIKLYADRHGIDPNNIEILDRSIRFRKFDTWCLTWFSHYTYNIDLTDEEALESFLDYREKYMKYNEESSPYYMKYSDPNYQCLMGAEERGRIGHTDQTTKKFIPDKPCRCHNCTKNGVITFEH